MRVGVHTGTVLCGIVGTRRFKFDVWSNDVTLANTMESSGEPGKVHISEATREFLVDEYDMSEGEEVAGKLLPFYYVLTLSVPCPKLGLAEFIHFLTDSLNHYSFTHSIIHSRIIFV